MALSPVTIGFGQPWPPAARPTMRTRPGTRGCWIPHSPRWSSAWRSSRLRGRGYVCSIWRAAPGPSQEPSHAAKRRWWALTPPSRCWRVARKLLPELDFQIADAHALPFSGGEFDVVTCGLALSHFHEPLTALRDTLRVLRRDGRLVASAWSTGGGTPCLGTVDELLERHHAPDKGYTLDEETWQDPEQGSRLLHHVGFAAVPVKTESFTGRFADPEQALRWSFAWPSRAARLARLDPKDDEAFVAEARRALAETDLSWNFVFNIYIAAKTAGR
jgi:SAM-dependent methyltransferase